MDTSNGIEFYTNDEIAHRDNKKSRPYVRSPWYDDKR